MNKGNLVFSQALLSIFLISYISASVAQIPPQPPLVRPDSNNKYWILMEDMEYEIGTTSIKVVVPAGFVTDFASIPQPLWSFGLTPHGAYSRAAVIHDYLYWTQGCTKAQSDRIMLIAMKESQASSFDEQIIYEGVNRLGESSWLENQAQRDKGLPRILPPNLRRLPPNVAWPEYRKAVKAAGLAVDTRPIDPPYCKYGDGTEIPGAKPEPLRKEIAALGPFERRTRGRSVRSWP